MVVRTALVFLILMIVQLPSPAVAAVSAQLSAQDIDELESVVLTIRAGGTRQTETLDLEALEKDFEILNTNTSSNYRFVNGREQSWVDYQITLQPKRVGELAIPAVTIGRDTTPTMTLRVRKLTAAMRDTIDRKVFFESEISASSIYVQAQLILTRRLFYSQGVQLYSDLPGAPEIENAVVLTLGETTSSKTTRDGLPYGVIEQRYAIFPEASGEFTIPSVNITASVRLNENGRFSRKGVRVATDANRVVIKPVPASYPADQPWLPATNVRVLQAIDATADVEVGDTLLHEFLIQVDGNVGSAAPPQSLQLADTQFRTYPQTPTIQDDTNGATVVGARLQTTSLVPLVPGSLQVPAQTVYWWNTDTDSLQQATTQSLTLEATGTAITQAPNESPDGRDGVQPTDEELTGTEGVDLQALLASPTLQRLAIGLLIATVLVVMLLTLKTKLTGWSRNRTHAHARLQALQQATSDREFYAGLLSALQAPTAQQHQPSIQAFESSVPQVEAILTALRSRLYGEPQSDSNHETINKAEKRIITKALRTYLNTPSSTEPATLPPLYPNA